MTPENIKTIDEDEWISKCGVVMQKGFVFSGSIIENVALRDETPNIFDVQEALKIACLWDFVLKLPMGLYTNIGNCGIELSGGQLQRLMIARAIYKKPDVLFLDEATSHLDANLEKIVINNIKEEMRGKTLIISAHRLSNIKDVDKIFFIKDGYIVESGSHYELLKAETNYKTLFLQQL